MERIRDLNIRDIEWVKEIFEDVRNEMNCDFEDLEERYFDDIDTSDEYIIGIGFKCFCRYKLLEDGTVWIKNIAVKKDIRGKGYGTKLIKYLKGGPYITTVYKGPAEKFYKLNGFYEIGEVFDVVGKSLIVYVKD